MAELLVDFIKKLPRMAKDIETFTLRQWDIQTLDIMGEAQSNAPVASGDLEGSAKGLKAKITSRGIQSSIIFDIPYAFDIHRGIIKGKRIRLREPGEISSIVKGIKIKKQRKGKFFFLSTAVEKGTPMLIDRVLNAVSRAFKKL